MTTKSHSATALTVFSFDSHAVRTVLVDGEPWFVAADVCEVLSITNNRNATSRLDDDEKGVRTMDTPSGPQEMGVINESGLYSLILGSRKPEAKRFKKWVTSEVLPSIRKTGGYQDAERIKRAFALASEVADQAARTVFESVMAGNNEGEWSSGRWIFAIHFDQNHKAVPWAKEIGSDEMVVSLAELPGRLLEPNGMMPSNKELADLASACMQRLSKRLTTETRGAL